MFDNMSRTLFCIFLVFVTGSLFSQKTVAVGFWNVENLYDTLNDPLTQDDEFTPQGKNAWNSFRYLNKLNKLAEVIAGIGTEETREGLALVGLCEVENAAVLNDLVNTRLLKQRGYRFVLEEGPDARGIDVALLYHPKFFSLQHVKSYPVQLPDSTRKTRNILLAGGELAGEKVWILVNHWPSRRGGEAASRPSRLAAAERVCKLIDSLHAAGNQKILVMGDFNDDPVSFSVREMLCKRSGMYNPMTRLFKKGIGSLAWNDRWNLFDQILMSPEFQKGVGWSFKAAYVYNRDFLRAESGSYRGYPYRTYSGGAYTAGYSDHFPVYVVLERSVSLK